MDYPVTQEDIALCTSPVRKARMKIELLSMQGQTLTELSGEVQEGSMTIDAGSDVRRVINLTLCAVDGTIDYGAEKKVWLDKKLRVSYGIERAEGEWAYYPMGVYAYTEAAFSLGGEAAQARIAAGDLMVFTLGTRGSQIGASTTVIVVDSDIRNAMIATLSRFTPLRDYAIEEFPADQQVVPYDLEFASGCYAHDMIAQMRDLYPSYETFMDVYGTFICRKIPDHAGDPVFLDEHVIDPLILSEEVQSDFGVRNVTEIWGAELETDRTAEQTTAEGDTYTATLNGYAAYVNQEKIGVTPPSDSIAGQKMRVNDLAACPIVIRRYASGGVQVDEPIDPGVMRAGYPYVLRYMDGKWLYEGELSVHAIVKEVSSAPTAEQIKKDEEDNDCRTIGYVVNPESPYSVEKLGEIRQVFSGGEYDAITTSQLALERCRWENWKKTRLCDGATLTTLLLPFMEVNKKIRYTSPRTGKTLTWLVRSVSMDFAGSTMTMELIRFYPQYEWYEGERT